MANTVTIRFKADDKSDLLGKIKKLDQATKALINTQAKIVQSNIKQKQSTKNKTSALKKLNIQLLAHGSKLKNLKLNTDLYSQAMKGNRVAIEKVRIATRAHIKELRRQNKGLLDTQHGTRILGGSFAVLRSKMLLASFGAGLFSMSIGKLTKLFGEQEKAERKLETAIGRHSRTLLAFASAQQQVTTFGDEETIVAMSLLGAYTDNEKAIARLTKVSMDLATAKGMDLNSAVDLVSKSVFSSTNAMSRYGIEIEGSAGSTARLESAVKNISALYGGQAEANANTYLGSTTQLSNSVGDLGERFGSVLAPSVMLSAKALKVFADSIDTEEIKAYGTVLVSTALAYVAFTKGALIATKAMALFNKISKKNLAILAGMITVGAVIDKLNLFKESTGDLADEIENLEGALGGLNNKQTTSLDLSHQLAMSQLNYANTLQNVSPIEQQRDQNALEFNQIREKHGVTEANFGRMMKENIPFQIEYNQNRQKSVEIERNLNQIKLDSVSTTLGAFSQMNKALKGNAKITKRLAQASAIIDTYAGANKALASAPPPFNYIAMAGVIASGLANVANIEAQKFQKGGLVGGRRHSQGGTMIEAERGEFVMSRQAVQSIGIEAMNQINQGGGGGVTVNISGGIVDQSYVNNELIPAINKATSLGTRVNA